MLPMCVKLQSLHKSLFEKLAANTSGDRLICTVKRTTLTLGSVCAANLVRKTSSGWATMVAATADSDPQTPWVVICFMVSCLECGLNWWTTTVKNSNETNWNGIINWLLCVKVPISSRKQKTKELLSRLFKNKRFATFSSISDVRAMQMCPHEAIF